MPAPAIVTVLMEAVARAALDFLTYEESAGLTPEHECSLLGKVAVQQPDGSFECQIPTPPPSQRPAVNSVPQVSQPPTNIYNTQNQTTNITNNSTTIIINLPERRLPKSDDDYEGGRGSRPISPTGGGTRPSAPSKVITVKNPIKNKEYGALLHEPISNSPVQLKVSVDRNFKNNFAQNQAQAAKRFVGWLNSLSKQSDTSTTESNSVEQTESTSYNITDASIAIISRSFKNALSPKHKTVPVFGSKGIAEFIGGYLNRSLIDLKVNNLIPSNIIISNINSESDYTDSENKLLAIFNQLIFDDSSNSIDLTTINQVLGIDDFPISVPETLISEAEGILNTPIDIPQKDLTSIPQLMHWYIERFDEVMGQWSVPIEIKDIDPTTSGDQSKLMNFPNIAELLAEMMMILLQVSINSELLTNINTRILMEAGQDKQQNLITYKLLQSLTDYIGYSYKDKIVEMPLLFDPKATDFDQMLTEVLVKVPVPEFDEKFNLQADFMRFRKAASIIDSVYFRKVNPNEDIKTQLMKRLFDLRDLLKETNNSDEKWKEFLKQVEAGFTDIPGVGDPAKPYGKDYEERPRFRDINSQGIIDDI